jgi:cyclopropane-fatty-acyl-phospholipid synthase
VTFTIRPPPPCSTIRRATARREEGADEVHVDDAPQQCDVQVEHRAHREDPRVVHEHVDPAEALRARAGHRLDLRLVGDVGGEGRSAPRPCGLEGRGGLGSAISTAAPASCRRSATARPIPMAPPVTIAARPEKSMREVSAGIAGICVTLPAGRRNVTRADCGFAVRNLPHPRIRPMHPTERLVASGRVPDPLLRAGIRALLAQRLLRERARARSAGDPLAAAAARRSHGPIAVAVDAANDQHYAVPPAFFRAVLGPRLKYSCCRYDAPGATLAQAEEAMLALTAERARIADGMRVLELGCGWGSLSLWLLERFPALTLTAVSNSAAQRAFLEARARERGLAARLTVHTLDVSDLDLGERFDRVVSVEMFEHARNWAALLARVREHLDPGGSAFVHVFAHRRLDYPFEDGWMARRFFTGGTMPAFGVLERLSADLRVEERWWVDGTHYAHTARDWLANLDARRAQARAALAGAAPDPGAALEEWRVFFLAVEELFGFRGGREWGVGHYRLAPA